MLNNCKYSKKTKLYLIGSKVKLKLSRIKF